MTAAPAASNPALQQFVLQLGDEFVLAQVCIRRAGHAYDLRHVEDRATAPESLRLVALSELRAIAQLTASGVFRPLKSAPTLQSGWRAVAPGDAELEGALDQLYPGAIADWYAAQTRPAPVTDFREFTVRQTGMYRVTTLLNDEQAARVVRACCPRHFCLKRRLWTLPGLERDAETAKSAIPCLEPCAVLLEFARACLRMEQEEAVQVALSPADLETVLAALDLEPADSSDSEREADFNSPSNPRRRQWVLEKLKHPEPSNPNEQ
jgi:hypothetical protein